MVSKIETPYVDHLLPDQATPLEIAISGSEARLLQAPVQVIRDVWDPDRCPAHLLAYLAAAWSVDVWDPEWAETTKRAVIKASPEIHRRKGTPFALKSAVSALGYGVSVREWFEANGAAYTFSLFVAVNDSFSRRDWANLLATILAAKNTRSWLAEDGLTLETLPLEGMAKIGAVVLSHHDITIYPPLAHVEITAPLQTGAALLAHHNVEVFPQALHFAIAPLPVAVAFDVVNPDTVTLGDKN